MFGIESGEIVWIAAAATGLAALLATSEEALGVLRYVGAAYLIYLGVQRWREVEQPANPARASLPAIFGQGVVTQLVNPKVAIFFVAFLPQFLDPSRALPSQVAMLGLVYVAIAIAVDTCYVLTASAVAKRLLRSAAAQRRTGRIAAVTYVALGVAAAASGVRKP